MYHLSNIYPSSIYLFSITSLSKGAYVVHNIFLSVVDNDLLYSLFYRQRISYDRMFTMCCLFQQIIQYTCIHFNHHSHLKFVLGVAQLDRCASSHDSLHGSPQVPDRSQLRYPGSTGRASQFIPTDRRVPWHAGTTVPHQHRQLYVPALHH